jgi:rRNA maturation endonuclease Nob1
LNTPDSVVNDLARGYSDAGYQPAQLMTPTLFGDYSNSDEILNAKVGDVVSGVNTGQMKVMRVLGEQDTGSMIFYHAKNITIGFGRPENKDSAKLFAQKLYNDLKAGADFTSTARQYSQDPSVRRGGDMHWLGQKMYIPQVEEIALKAPIGEVQAPIETNNGFVIIQVVGRTKRKIKVGTIPVDIRPSSQTTKMVQQQANIFREKAVKDGFDQAAQAQSLRVTSEAPPVVKKGSQPMFGYMPWVNYLFDLSSGDITVPVRIPTARLTVVAQVTDALPEGVKPLDSLMKEQIKVAIAKHKSIEALASKAKELRAALSPGDDLSKLTSLDSNYRPTQVSMGPAESTPGVGTDYAVNNVAFAMKVGEISQPIEGEGGYYIIKLIDLKPADKKQFDAQKTQEFEKLNQEKQQRFFGQWLDQLKDKAKVIDYRSHQM